MIWELGVCTVSSHKFNSQKVNLRVSNPFALSPAPANSTRMQLLIIVRVIGFRVKGFVLLT